MKIESIILANNFSDKTPNYRLVKRLDKLKTYKKYKGLSHVCIKAAKAIVVNITEGKPLEIKTVKLDPQKDCIIIEYIVLNFIPMIWITIDNEGEVALSHFLDEPYANNFTLRSGSKGWGRLVTCCNIFNHLCRGVEKNRVRLEKEFIDAVLRERK